MAAKKKSGKARKTRRRAKKKAEVAKEDAEAALDEAANAVKTGDTDDDTYGESGLKRSQENLLVRRAIRERWNTGSSQDEIRNLDIKNAIGRDIAIAMTYRNMAHADPTASNTAVRNFISMEGQNQKDQIAEYLHGAQANAKPQEAIEVNVAVAIGDLRREMLSADKLDGLRQQALEEDAAKMATKNRNGSGNGHYKAK